MNKGVRKYGSIPKQWRERDSMKVDPKAFVKPFVKPVAPVHPVVKKEPKLKEKLSSDDPIIDNKEEEELDKAELKRRKAREAEMNEHQRIIREADKKERAELEARDTLQSDKLLFPKWTLKRIQNDAVDLPNQY
uniref:Uncharacterized protein n=1 Tax=Lactuca sativa TaxID=4236 RepID=A0A9R1W6I8_LACSA|nr:hypothetical protein LSAT_V11C300101850 [Lactuca sativa]